MAISQLDSFMHSLGELESGNNYHAVGPYTGSTYGRARGRWQIMENIYPAWAREAGVDPNDWSPAAQERVARFKMTQYYNTYGSWDLVAVAWFAGPARANQAKRNGIASVGGIEDMLGTDVSTYVSKVIGGMGGGTERDAERGLMRQPGNPSSGGGTERTTERGLMRQGSPISAPMESGMTERTTERGLLRQGSSPLTAGLGQRTIGPMEAAPGATLTPVQEQIRNDQIGQDSLGAIMATISEAAKNAGGGILDARSLFGMPTRVEPQAVDEPVVANLAPEPSQPQPAGQGDMPMAEPPSHSGFEGLKDNAKSGSQALMGQFPGLRFTSGYRDPQRNREAGGVANSKHLTGEASDFVGSEEEMQAAAAWAKANGAVKTLIHDSGSGRHLHIEWA